MRVAALLGAMGAMALAAAPAQAGTACGDTINNDTTLTADITCNTAIDGLTIGGSDIRLDLNGHTISGPVDGSTAGINAIGTGNLRIVNGRIIGFGRAVVAETLEGLSIRELKVNGSAESIRIADVDGAVVNRSVLRDPSSNTNLRVEDSSEIEVEGTKILGANLTVESTDGFTATANLVKADSGLNAINIAGGTNVALRENSISDALTGISSATADRARIVGNEISGVGGSGIFAAGGAKLVRNRIAGSAGNGITVPDGTGLRVLRGNFAVRNGGDGIHVSDPDAVLNNNTANRNDDNGVDSESSNGSGNAANNNANRDCIPNSLCA